MTEQRDTSTYDPLPEEIASWLTNHKWQRVSNNPQRPALWTLRNRELLQPTILDANDYDLRLSQMLRNLASWTERSAEAIADEMIHEGSDVTEWRAKGLRDRDSSVPLEDGLILVQSVRNAFVAAANATIQRRAYFGHSTLKVARDHVRDVRMGQTRRGSYIVPIISRVPGVTEQHEEQQGRLDIEVSAQPFERRVMALLADALLAVHELAVLADHEPSASVLNERVGQGVSHELCAALNSMLAVESFSDVDVSFSWARRAAGHPNIQRVEFPKESRHIISNMAENLRGSDVIAEQVLSGLVWITKHAAGESEGSLKVHAQIGSTVRTVTVPLSREQVHAAQAAAAEEAPVFIRGQLVRGQGRAWHFESVSEFGVAEAAPLAWDAGTPVAAEHAPTTGESGAKLEAAETLTADLKAQEDAAHTFVEDLVQRWKNYSPETAEILERIVHGLRSLGYTLQPSISRSAAAQRTYLRALAPNGNNAGYLHSTSFTFVAARDLKMLRSNSELDRSGRYPYLSLKAPGAAEIVLSAADEYRNGV